MAKSSFSDAQRSRILAEHFSPVSSEGGGLSDSEAGVASSLVDAVAAAHVRDDSGSFLMTESGIAVSADAALDDAKALFDAELSSRLEGVLGAGLTTPEAKDELSRIGHAIIENSFDTGLGSLSPEQAGQALEGYRTAAATAALSLDVNNLQGVHDKVAGRALESGDTGLQTQVLSFVAHTYARAHRDGVSTVEGLQPAVDALDGISAPTVEQARTLNSVRALEDAALKAFSAGDADSVSKFSESVRSLAGEAHEAFGDKGATLRDSLNAFADAVDRADISGARDTFAAASGASQDLTREALQDFVRDAGPALASSQQELNAFAPTALAGMERFNDAMGRGAGDLEDLGNSVSRMGANVKAIEAAAAGLDDASLEVLDDMKPDMLLMALSQRGQMASEHNTQVTRESEDVRFNPEGQDLSQTGGAAHEAKGEGLGQGGTSHETDGARSRGSEGGSDAERQAEVEMEMSR